MKKIIILILVLASVMLLASCSLNFQDKMEQMSENLKDQIIDMVGDYIEKNTDTGTDEVLDNDTSSKPSDAPTIPSTPSDIPSDIPSDVPSDKPSDIPTDSEGGDTPDVPVTPPEPEIPEYIVLEREKHPLSKYTGLDIFKLGSKINDKEYKFRSAYGYGRFETTLDDIMGSNPLAYFTISGMETAVHIDFDLSKAKNEAIEGEIAFSEIASKIWEFSKKYCVNSLTSKLTRVEIGSNPDKTISASEYALLLNLIYDNNCKQNGYDVENPGTTFINPNIRLITGKMSSYNLPYIKELMEQVDIIRDDDFSPIGGWSFSVNTQGKTPEEIFAQNEALKELIAYRNENYNSVEIHLSDFGWDTVNTESEIYIAPSDKYSSEELQAMYILRSFLILQGMDVDKASYDLLNDSDTNGHGIIAKDGAKKLSFTMLEYFKEKMDGMSLSQVVSSGDKDLYCYKFENENGKTIYAFWSPNGASLNLSNQPQSATLSYYDPSTKSYTDQEITIGGGMFSKRVNETVMFLEY